MLIKVTLIIVQRDTQMMYCYGLLPEEFSTKWDKGNEVKSYLMFIHILDVVKQLSLDHVDNICKSLIKCICYDTIFLNF